MPASTSRPVILPSSGTRRPPSHQVNRPPRAFGEERAMEHDRFALLQRPGTSNGSSSSSFPTYGQADSGRSSDGYLPSSNYFAPPPFLSPDNLSPSPPPSHGLSPLTTRAGFPGIRGLPADQGPQFTSAQDMEFVERSIEYRRQRVVSESLTGSESHLRYYEDGRSTAGSVETGRTRESAQAAQFIHLAPAEQDGPRISLSSSSGVSHGSDTSSNTRHLVNSGHTQALQDRYQRLHRTSAYELSVPSSAIGNQERLNGRNNLEVPGEVTSSSPQSRHPLRHIQSVQNLRTAPDPDRDVVDRPLDVAPLAKLKTMLGANKHLSKFFSNNKDPGSASGSGEDLWEAYVLNSAMKVVVRKDGIHIYLPSHPGVVDKPTLHLSKTGLVLVTLGKKIARSGRLKYIGTYRVSDGSKISEGGATFFMTVLACLRLNSEKHEFSGAQEEGVVEAELPEDLDGLERELRASIDVRYWSGMETAFSKLWNPALVSD